MAGKDKYASMAAAAAAVATLTMPETRTWVLAAPCWIVAAVFGFRWWLEVRADPEESSIVLLGDITPRVPAVPVSSSSPSPTLAALNETGARRSHAPIESVSARLTWHDLEDRFGRVPGEVEAIWSHYATGQVEWSVHSRDSSDGRIVERFISEARIAGRLVREYPTVRRKFPGPPSEDDVDNWLNVVAAFVRSDMDGDGRDERGEHETGAFERAIDASKLVCARLASEAPARTPRVATRLLELHGQVVHKILNVAPPAQDRRGPLAAEWIPLAQQWDRDVIQAMRDVGCKPDEVHYVETFPLPTSARRDWFTWDMNSQWTISDIRRERLEKVIDRYLDQPIFTA